MKLVRMGAIAPLLMLLMTLAGCGPGEIPSPSNLFVTNNIYAYMKAVQDESGDVITTVQLRDGNLPAANYINLSGGDTLYSSLDVPPRQYLSFEGDLFANSLNVSQQLKVMAERDLYRNFILYSEVLWGKPEYFASGTPAGGASPVRAYVGFERAGNALVGESSVALPPAFQILAPVAESSLSRATPVTLSWTDIDAASTMELDVAGDCLDGNRYTQHFVIGADTGTVTLNSADYFPATGVSPTISCRVAFMFQRVRLGGISTDFAFGSFTGVQQRTVQFTSVP
jgi:hypothetical protein